jgi:uncharacterized membrane protein YkvA (DUF1232 family)
MLVLALLLVSNLSVSVVHVGETLSLWPAVSSALSIDLTTDSESFDSHLRGWTNEGVGGARRWVRRSVRLVAYSVVTWLGWLRGALKFIVLAAIVALAEGRLLSIWRLEGWRPLRSYLPLMLYVYACLFADERVPLSGKILVLLSIVHGVVPRDLIPDRSVFPGLLDDVFLIVLAVHLFRRSCEQPLIDHWARKAVDWRERVAALRSA